MQASSAAHLQFQHSFASLRLHTCRTAPRTAPPPTDNPLPLKTPGAFTLIALPGWSFGLVLELKFAA